MMLGRRRRDPLAGLVKAIRVVDRTVVIDIADGASPDEVRALIACQAPGIKR